MVVAAAAPPAFFSKLSLLKHIAGAEYFQVPAIDATDTSELDMRPDTRLPSAPNPELDVESEPAEILPKRSFKSGLADKLMAEAASKHRHNEMIFFILNS